MLNLTGQVLEGFLFENLLGNGSYGLVYKASKGGKNYAIKAVSRKNGGDTEMLFVEQLKFSCPFLVKYFNSIIEPDTVFIIMEYCPKGDLDALVKRLCPSEGIVLSETRLMRIIIQLLLGLKELHQRNMIHRDLKAANVFIDEHDVVKLGDFGCGKILDTLLKNAVTFVGSLLYMAPEIGGKEGYSFSADIWSLGVLFYYLCTAEHPFTAFSSRTSYSPIPADLCSGELRGMIDTMLCVDPLKRPNIDTLLRKPFILKYADCLGLINHFPNEILKSYLSPLTFSPPVSSSSTPSSSSSCPSSFSSPPSSSESVYTGDIVDGVINGEGKIDYHNKNSYNGTWTNDKKNGKGVYYFADGSVYTGNYVDDLRNGQGEIKYTAGNKYNGEWKEDKITGKGTYTFRNKDIYEGDFIDGVRTGQGTIKYTGGDMYEGEWKDDKPTGNGKYTFTNGNVYHCDFDGSFIVVSQK